MKEVNQAWNTHYLQQIYTRNKNDMFSSCSLFAFTVVLASNKGS